jgi:hypothetical protein
MQLIHGMTPMVFEVVAVNKYINKVDSSRKRGIEFALTFSEYRRLLSRKRCAYTGITLSFHRGQSAPTNADLTIERIDNEKGYVKGNVIVVCSAANSVKGVLEDPNTFLSVKDAIRMFSKIESLHKNLK